MTKLFHTYWFWAAVIVIIVASLIIYDRNNSHILFDHKRDFINFSK